MKRIAFVIAFGLVIASLLVFGHHQPAQAAPTNTPVCGMLATTTWNQASSPYQVCAAGATVPAGATLTIEPGVSVLFVAGPGNKLLVQGALIAHGTDSQAITFSGATATPGSWGGLSVLGTAALTPAVASLSYATLDYGGFAGTYGAALYADKAVITLTHSLVTHSAGNGVYVEASARFDAHDTQFIGNGQHAILLSQPTTDLTMDGLSASGNGTDAVFLSGNATWTGMHSVSAPGIPYVVNGPFGNVNLGDVLFIAPGNTFQFTPTGWLYVRGRFNALGTPSQPITFTGQTQTPGAWQGLFIDGGVHQAVAQLDYVTIEYGGRNLHGANIEVANGRLLVRHSLIRHSARDGVRFDVNWGGSIMESQIVDNAGYGVRNATPQRHVQATNNWWGDAAGPQSDVVGCSTSLTGSPVTAGVYFLPVRTSPTATVQLPLSNAPNISVTPRRWFAPADGFTRIYFDIVVRDGNGVPIPGRTVTLASSLGTVTSGGVTNGNGEALAWLTSTNPGDANVIASLNAVTCEGYLAPETRVTFIAPINTTDLYPNAQSPYMANEIVVSPQPVLVGIMTTIGTTLTNPLSVSVTVDVSFGYADAGIGLVFGPLAEIIGQVIPADSTIFLSTDFLPPVSGHYCVEITYNITAIGSVSLLAPQAAPQRVRTNLNVFQGPLGSPNGKESLRKANNAFNAVSHIPSGPTQIQKGLLGRWWAWASGSASTISQNLGGDPPRQDFDVVTVPVWHPIPPVQPGVDISVARAAALNAVNDSWVEIEAYGTAATVALDRYGGASAAGNVTWASEQANAQLHYQALLGTALLTYADRLEAFVALLQSEGETETTLSASDVISYQQRLENTGFTVQEIADAQAFGLTPAQIEAHRLEIIAADPLEVAGDLLEIYTELAAVGRELGNSLLYPPSPNFDPGYSVSGSPGFSTFGESRQATTAGGNTMVQVFNTVSTFKLSNPLTQTALIDLRPRRVDLPADWTIAVSPAQITLDPGQIVTVTVTALAGSPTPQGIIPRLAVEGYVGSQLIGGMVIDILIPNYDPYLGQLVFLPLVLR